MYWRNQILMKQPLTLLDPEYYAKYFNRFRDEKEVEEHGKVVVGDTTTTYFALPAEALAALEKLK
jgi:hypothetical protein